MAGLGPAIHEMPYNRAAARGCPAPGRARTAGRWPSFCHRTASAASSAGDFGVKLPAETQIRIWDSTAETRFLVLPMRPAGTENWSEEQLAGLVTRDSMVGTGLAKSPAALAAEAVR